MSKTELVNHEYTKKHGAKLKSVRGRGLNKFHLELEALLGGGKRFTIGELAQYQGCNNRRAINRLEVLCKHKGYKMTQVARTKHSVFGKPARLFVLTKIVGEQ